MSDIPVQILLSHETDASLYVDSDDVNSHRQEVDTTKGSKAQIRKKSHLERDYEQPIEISKSCQLRSFLAMMPPTMSQRELAQGSAWVPARRPTSIWIGRL